MDKNYQRLEEFSKLEHNWNGYNAEPIPKDVLQTAKDLIPHLTKEWYLYPTGRQSVQFEREDETYYEIEIFSDKIEAFKMLGDDWEQKEYKDLPELLKGCDWL